jgi:predicted O-linked N-acetylglucosamine transferase (SPINDLY family)
MTVQLKQKGDFLLSQGRASDAIFYYRQAIEQTPDYAEAFNNLGIAFKHQNRLDDAIACYHAALKSKPDYAIACNNLANAHRDRGDLVQAKKFYQKALDLKPDFAEVLNNLGNVLMEQGNLNDAILKYQTALRIKPDYCEAYNNLGNAFQEQKDLTAAIHCYENAIQINPQYYKAFNNLGNAYQRQGRLNQAVICYQKTIGIRPGYSEAFNNIGNALVEFGKISEAIGAYTKALELNPAYTVAHSNLLLSLQYHTGIDLSAHYAAASKWWQQQAQSYLQPVSFEPLNNRQKKLKIGYISPDFRQHSVSFFLLPFLQNHDCKVDEIFCYSAVKSPDILTDRIRKLSDHWCSIMGLSDMTVAEQVRRDGIDILVDLAGHTSENRLLVFAHRPAPVQVTWLGYPGTTGMPVIDYRLTDDIADPPGESDKYHSESLIRLPQGFLCYGPPKDAPEVSGLPARRNGCITFGSFNNLPKINPEVIGLWSRLLHQVVDSRLVLKSKQFADEHVRQRFLALFFDCGVAAERVTLLPRVASTAGHLSLYHQVDIGLDPFPYNGTTTTCEALWMGVPVITLRGDRHAGRVGASILTRLGLGDMVAEDEDKYVGIGIKLAQDINALATLRSGMRSRMQSSGLCDGKSFARTMENIFQKVWQTRCQKNDPVEQIVR